MLDVKVHDDGNIDAWFWQCFFYEGDEVNVYVDVDAEVNVHDGDMMMFDVYDVYLKMFDVDDDVWCWPCLRFDECDKLSAHVRDNVHVNVDNIGVWCSLWCLMFTMMMMMFDVHHDDDVDGWCSLYWCW